MTTYTVYLGASPIAVTAGVEYTYTVWRKTVELAELTGLSASLVWDETGEVVEDYNDEGEEGVVLDYSDESGFDPYMGCYTGDC
jgi:hypothetical protein